MLFKRKKKIEAPEQPKMAQTIQKRMDEVYNWHIQEFLKEMDSGKVDIEIKKNLSWFSFDNAIVGCSQDAPDNIVYDKKQTFGINEVNELAEKACKTVTKRIIEFAESHGYKQEHCDVSGRFFFTADKRKDLSKIESDIDSWHPKDIVWQPAS